MLVNNSDYLDYSSENKYTSSFIQRHESVLHLSFSLLLLWILPCLTPDDFTREGKASTRKNAQLVIFLCV